MSPAVMPWVKAGATRMIQGANTLSSISYRHASALTSLDTRPSFIRSIGVRKLVKLSKQSACSRSDRGLQRGSLAGA
jgi:hypothetical protein